MSSIFQISSKVHHAVLIMTDLTDESDRKGYLSLEDIAQREHISQGFLEEVASSLRKAGLIRGKRGSNGGYRLAKSSCEITLKEVIEAVSGPIRIIECVDEINVCRMFATCTSRYVWTRIQAQLTQTLSQMTLQSISFGKTRIF